MSPQKASDNPEIDITIYEGQQTSFAYPGIFNKELKLFARTAILELGWLVYLQQEQYLSRFMPLELISFK